MIKEHAVKQKLIKHLGFYLVLMLCMAMISFACWYAYEQTKQQINIDLNSAVGDIKVMEVQTDIPKATEPPTERETLPETKPETIHTQPLIVQPLQTAPIQTEVITGGELSDRKSMAFRKLLRPLSKRKRLFQHQPNLRAGL